MWYFLKRSILFLLCVVAMLAIYITYRVRGFDDQVSESRYLDSWQKVLFIGDSHIGCTFVEERCYENSIVWESSMPPQFTLMRMLDMEREGMLGNVDTLVTEVGLQSIGQQNKERMRELWWRMLPISYRYPDLLPINAWDKLIYAARHYQDRIHIYEGLPTNNISVLTRSKEERDSEFAQAAQLNFTNPQHPELMCDGWEQSLLSALAELSNVCKRNNIRFVVLTAPVTSYYRAAIPEKVEEMLQNIVVRMRGLGIEYYDLRQWGEDAEFRDSFHFTFDGATRFTGWFYKEILRRE